MRLNNPNGINSTISSTFLFYHFLFHQFHTAGCMRAPWHIYMSVLTDYNRKMVNSI